MIFNNLDASVSKTAQVTRARIEKHKKALDNLEKTDSSKLEEVEKKKTAIKAEKAKRMLNNLQTQEKTLNKELKYLSALELSPSNIQGNSNKKNKNKAKFLENQDMLTGKTLPKF